MAQVRKEIEGVQRLDFDRGEGIPESWEQLRKEARKLVKNLPVYEAVLKSGIAACQATDTIAWTIEYGHTTKGVSVQACFV